MTEAKTMTRGDLFRAYGVAKMYVVYDKDGVEVCRAPSKAKAEEIAAALKGTVSPDPIAMK